jgi:hypothetical protein
MAKKQNIKWEEMNQWEIIDSTGVIHSGTQNDMLSKWEELVNSETEEEWMDDIKLVEVHGIYK